MVHSCTILVLIGRLALLCRAFNLNVILMQLVSKSWEKRCELVEMKLFLFLIEVAMMLIDLMQLSTQRPLFSNKECSSSAVSACSRPAYLFIVVIEDRPEEILI